MRRPAYAAFDALPEGRLEHFQPDRKGTPVIARSACDEAIPSDGGDCFVASASRNDKGGGDDRWAGDPSQGENALTRERSRIDHSPTRAADHLNPAPRCPGSRRPFGTPWLSSHEPADRSSPCTNQNPLGRNAPGRHRGQIKVGQSFPSHSVYTHLCAAAPRFHRVCDVFGSDDPLLRHPVVARPPACRTAPRSSHRDCRETLSLGGKPQRGADYAPGWHFSSSSYR